MFITFQNREGKARHYGQGDTMLASQRHQYILKQLEKKGSILTNDIINDLKVSPATIRNDLTFLETKGLLKKTYGGALIIEGKQFNYTNFHYRERINLDLKSAIVDHALKYIHDDQAIVLDASTTCLALAERLSSFRRLTVITNGVYTLLALKEMPNITVIVIGGIVTKGSGSIEGILAEEMLNNICIDVAFLSGHGFNLQSGITDFNFYEVELKKLMLKRSKKVIGLIDSTKLGLNSIGTFARKEDISVLITDNRNNQDLVQEYIEAGINIEVVEL
jgi:DeoR/GlpR family transcriptional regulator of sugar metabolism